jgi:O-antigen ligase/peptidoglycan/xylan/chitin deacetylase (PgdA/CDA1 family)
MDAIGVGLGAALLAWTLLSAVVTGTNPLPMVGLLLAVGGAFLASRAAGGPDRPWGAAAVVLVGLSVLLVSFGGVTDLTGGPLGYENAKASFFIQAGVAALVVVVVTNGSLRILAALSALAFLGAAALTGSRAGLALLVLPVLGAVVPPGRLVRVWIAVAAVLFVAALVTTTVLAANVQTDRPRAGGSQTSARGATASLGRDRVGLWQQAFAMMADHPWVGVGPGSFRVSSPIARRDADLGWAHNGFLQQGAETGVPGWILLTMLFLWGFGCLWLAPPGRVASLGAASLASLGIHASVDYILHFPVIPMAAAAILGTALARPRGGDRSGLRKAVKAAVLPMGVFTRRRPGDFSALLYHRVGAGDREIDLPVTAFRSQIAHIASRERALTLDDALEGGRGVVVTVDDGLRDFRDHVLPILVEHQVPALLYLATGLVVEEGGDPTDGLRWSHLQEAVGTGLVSVGSHTHTHADLREASAGEAQEEMRRSKELIEDRLGVPCRHFAYPWGVASPEADGVARSLFASAALSWGTNRKGGDPFDLRRVPILRSDGPFYFRAKVAGMLDGEAIVYRLVGRGPWRRP